MSALKCKMCGGDMAFEENATVATCEYCGTRQTLPKRDDEKRLALFERANLYRRENDYDKAAALFEQVLSEDVTDAEAYWCIVLCKYGVEYVKDYRSGALVPTLNRTQLTPVTADPDYKQAIRYADVSQREIYEREAAQIDRIQKEILDISQREKPFDVFICYKETDDQGRRTRDSVIANELYHLLTKDGYKVFFAKITLEDKLGTAYEPYIFAALNSAKVMVVLGTRPEYFQAVWVRNEWSRYLKLMQKDKEKILIPAYRDMDPYELPEEFAYLQALDMNKLGFMQDLTQYISKVVKTPGTPKNAVVTEIHREKDTEPKSVQPQKVDPVKPAQPSSEKKVDAPQSALKDAAKSSKSPATSDAAPATKSYITKKGYLAAVILSALAVGLTGIIAIILSMPYPMAASVVLCFLPFFLLCLRLKKMPAFYTAIPLSILILERFLIILASIFGFRLFGGEYSLNVTVIIFESLLIAGIILYYITLRNKKRSSVTKAVAAGLLGTYSLYSFGLSVSSGGILGILNNLGYICLFIAMIVILFSARTKEETELTSVHPPLKTMITDATPATKSYITKKGYIAAVILSALAVGLSVISYIIEVYYFFDMAEGVLGIIPFFFLCLLLKKIPAFYTAIPLLIIILRRIIIIVESISGHVIFYRGDADYQLNPAGYLYNLILIAGIVMYYTTLRNKKGSSSLLKKFFVAGLLGFYALYKLVDFLNFLHYPWHLGYLGYTCFLIAMIVILFTAKPYEKTDTNTNTL